MSNLNDIATKYYWTPEGREAVGELMEFLEFAVQGVDSADVVEGREMSAYAELRIGFAGQVVRVEILPVRREGQWAVEIQRVAAGAACWYLDTAEEVLWLVGVELAGAVVELNERLHERTQGFLRRAAEDRREICRLREELEVMTAYARTAHGVCEAVAAADVDELLEEFHKELDWAWGVSSKKEGA